MSGTTVAEDSQPISLNKSSAAHIVCIASAANVDARKLAVVADGGYICDREGRGRDKGRGKLREVFVFGLVDCQTLRRRNPEARQ